MKRLIVGISGASGVVMGHRLLKVLKQLPDLEVHLVITDKLSKLFHFPLFSGGK